MKIALYVLFFFCTAYLYERTRRMSETMAYTLSFVVGVSVLRRPDQLKVLFIILGLWWVGLTFAVPVVKKPLK
jgi:hypothetical protein